MKRDILINIGQILSVLFILGILLLLNQLWNWGDSDMVVLGMVAIWGSLSLLTAFLFENLKYVKDEVKK